MRGGIITLGPEDAAAAAAAIMAPLTRHPSMRLMESINKRPLLLRSVFNTRHVNATNLILT